MTIEIPSQEGGERRPTTGGGDDRFKDRQAVVGGEVKGDDPAAASMHEARAA